MADVPRPRTVPFGLAQQATGPGIYLQQAGGPLGFYTSVLFMNSALTFDAAGNAIVTPVALTAIGDKTILSNISGASAIPIGNTLSALLDSILGNTQGQLITRNAGTWTVLGPGAPGTVLTSGGPGANVSYAAAAGGGTQVKGAVWDGGGFSVVAGTALTDVPVYCPDAKTISKVTLLTRGSATGSCVIDIWKRAYSTYPPTVSDTITASALPTITSAIKYQDSTLTGWTTAVSAGDVLMFHVNSCNGFTNISIFLELT